MWTNKHHRHLTDEQLVECYLAEHGEVAAAADRSHATTCAACAQRYAALTRDLDLLADQASLEADAVFTPEVLGNQRNQIARRLESHGRRADIFLFPTRQKGRLASRTNLRRPARWVTAAAAAGLTVGLGLGLTVERFRVNRFETVSIPVSSGRLQSPPSWLWRGEPQFERLDAGAGVNDDELLAEIDSALVTRRAEELRALDALTPENVDISLRHR